MPTNPFRIHRALRWSALLAVAAGASGCAVYPAYPYPEQVAVAPAPGVVYGPPPVYGPAPVYVAPAPVYVAPPPITLFGSFGWRHYGGGGRHYHHRR